MSASASIHTETLVVGRTARIALLGPDGPALAGVRELWYVLHGYSQLAVPFLEDCRVLDDGTRLVVAPEALSRFYEGALAPGAHRNAGVGASWMTREARETEIVDYLAYLDAVHALVMGRLAGGTPRALPRVTVLGFSQGGATAARWVASGRVRPARLIVWGSQMAPELDLVSPGTPLRSAETILVTGTTDVYATPKIVEQELGRLRAAAFPFRYVTFAGGHRLDDDTLLALAAAVTDGDATGAA